MWPQLSLHSSVTAAILVACVCCQRAAGNYSGAASQPAGGASISNTGLRCEPDCNRESPRGEVGAEYRAEREAVQEAVEDEEAFEQIEQELLEELAYELGQLPADVNEAGSDDILSVLLLHELGVGDPARRRRLLERVHDSLERQLPSKREGRLVKRAREHHTKRHKRREIPDVSLSSVNELWDVVNSKRKLQSKEQEAAAQEQQPVFKFPSNRIQTQQEKVQAQLQTHIPHGNRRMLAADGAAVRALKGDRTNGVSEMPDPEAAEYLANHQTKALGTDVMNAVKNHYNGTQEEHVQPASTDSHATIEEHVTEGMDELALHAHTQHSESVAARYSAIHHHDSEDKSQPRRSAADSSDKKEEEQVTPNAAKQQGYPWYTQFPPPSFPQWNLTTTNKTLATELAAAKKTELARIEAVAKRERDALLAANARHAEAVAAKAAKERLTVADLARENVAKEEQAQAAIGNRPQPGGPGDGGEVPLVRGYIFISSGTSHDAPAAELAQQLAKERIAARVWMSPQEASLIESHLTPKDTMLEFGAGYSTMWFSQFVKEYYSIEHNETWFDEMKAQINATRKNVHLQVAPVIRGYKGWGGGFEEGTYQQFEHYIKAVDNFKVNSFDKVLIDGRARASCAEYVLKYLHPDSLVFIHDYQDRYFYHGIVEQHYQKVAETYEGQSLIVLRPKPDALKKAAKDAVANLASSQ